MKKEETTTEYKIYEKETLCLSTSSSVNELIYPDPNLKIIQNNRDFTDVKVNGSRDIHLIIHGEICASESLHECAFLGRKRDETQTDSSETKIVRFIHTGLFLTIDTSWEENRVTSNPMMDTLEIHTGSALSKNENRLKKDYKMKKADCQAGTIIMILLCACAIIFFSFVFS